MRCPECGHSLVGVPDDCPCTECGTVSALVERQAGPLPSPGRLFLSFGWPSLAGAALLFVPVLVMRTELDGMAVFVVVAAAVLLFLIGPLNSVRQASKLMQRLPRRVRAAPMLVLVPRSVMVPLLAGLATIPVNIALGFGACMGSMAFGRFGAGP